MVKALDGIKILDLSSGSVAGIATMILADFGADVIKIERPGGDPFRFLPNSPMWLRGKRSVELDLKRKVEQSGLHFLAQSVDVVVSNIRQDSAVGLGADYDVLSAKNSGLVYVHLTGFGKHGRYSSYPGYEDVVAAKTGRMQSFAGTVSREGPQFSAVQVASHAASQAIVSGVLAALIVRNRTGMGQYVQTSMLRSMLVYEQGDLIRRQLADIDSELYGTDPRLLTDRNANLQYQPVKTKDGWMQLANLLRGQFDSFIAAIGLHDIFVDERTQGGLGEWELEVVEEVRDRIILRMLEKTTEEWISLFSELGNIAAHPFQTTQEAMDDPDLRDNGHVVEVIDPRLGILIKDDITLLDSMLGQVQADPDPDSGRSEQLGLLAKLEVTPGEVGSAAPSVGEHTFEVLSENIDVQDRESTIYNDDTAPPLQGVTVLEFASIIAAPLGASQLADLGARVIKVEPVGGDPYRQLGGGVGAMRVNGSKQSIVINLKTNEGRKILDQLIGMTDLIISNFRPGVDERLGFDFAHAQSINPDIIYLAMNGYGQNGPGAHRPSAHPVPGAGVGGAFFQAGAGFPPQESAESLEVIREIGRRLFRGNEVNPDPNTSMVIMSSALLALYARLQGKGGQRIFIDMLGANAYANADDFIRYRGKPDRKIPDNQLLGTGPINRLYKCAGDTWVYLGIHLEKEWHQFCNKIQSPELAEDGRFSSRIGRDENAEELSVLLTDLFVTETADYWENEISSLGIGCVRADEKLPGEFWQSDDHVQENNIITEIDHFTWGSLLRHGTLWEMSRSELSLGPAPVMGEHTFSILSELNYNSDVIAQLSEEGIVTTA